MGISVIIPVYNAEEFVRGAVESVLVIPEVRQIILVEDRSPDNCLEICRELAIKYPDLVELHTHPDHQQKGAGASRNLGIEKAKEQFIAFLDADDYYLPYRFVHPLEILTKRPELDYVVSPSQLENDYLDNNPRYTMMGKEANNASGYLFPALLTERYGYFDTNSIIIRTEALKRLPKLFDPNLRLHQDSELWLRIAYELSGYAEHVTRPGSIVRRHSKNRVTHTNAVSLSLYWDVVSTEFQHSKLPNKLASFIRLKKKHYSYLKERSMLSYWYLLYMRIYEFVVLSRIEQWDALSESGRFQPHVLPIIEEREPMLMSS